MAMKTTDAPLSKTAKKSAAGAAGLKKANETVEATPARGGKFSAEAEKLLQGLEKAGALGDINRPIDFISTRNWVIDYIIGNGKGGPGGFPRGFMTEVHGRESCGKTTLCLQSIPSVQRIGELTIYMDFEKSLRAQQHYIKNMGIDVTDRSTFIHVEPDTLEEGAKYMFQMCLAMRPAYMVVDSVAAMIPAAFLTGNVEEATKVGLHARSVSIVVGTMNKILQKTNTALVFVNQLRAKIGGMGQGPQTDTTGGFAFKFYMHLRLQLTAIEKVSSDKTSTITGNTTKVTTDQIVKCVAIKNKMDKAFRSENVYLAFGKGFDEVRSLMDAAIKRGILQGSNWLTYVSKNNPEFNFKVNGKDACRAHLEEHPEIVDDMKPLLLPDVDVQELIAAKKDGELEEEALDPEMKKLLEQMSAGFDNVNSAPSLTVDEG